MLKYQVAVLGCGAIFSRHLAALQANSEHYQFIGYYDPDPLLQVKLRHELPAQRAYQSEAEVYQDPQVNCVVVLSPSYLHYTQAKAAIVHGKHVIIEKPASFQLEQLQELEQLATNQQVSVFCVLQVRLNPSISIAQQVLAQGLVGDIRSCSLVQRWQRPLSYFSGWRGSYAECGGILNEFGIHYLDIMQLLLGVPKVVAAKFYQTKFKQSQLADIGYALFDYGNFGASMEICLAAEPKNIEISLTILGSGGYLKLGGKSLDQIVAAEFLEADAAATYAKICNQILGYTIDNQVMIGACPHHPELYKQLVSNPMRFQLATTYNVIKLINEINNLS